MKTIKVRAAVAVRENSHRCRFQTAARISAFAVVWWEVLDGRITGKILRLILIPILGFPSILLELLSVVYVPYPF